MVNGMLIYTTTRSLKKPNRKTKREVEEYNRWLQSVNPSGKKPSKPSGSLVQNKPYRRGYEETLAIPSVDSGKPSVLGVKSIMDPFNLQKESEEVREAIIAKSKRVAIAYNKGGYQYLTDDTDPTTLGSSERRR
jgi:hypothetical protein